MESCFIRGLTSILLLIASNSFMTLASYGHLKFKEYGRLARDSLPMLEAISKMTSNGYRM